MARSELVEKALEMLKPAGRTPEPGSHEWWTAQWRDLAKLTHGLQPEDPRFGPVLAGLAVCDRHYKAADLDAFTKGAARVQRLMQFVPGATIRWEGTAKPSRTIFGPATVELVHHNNGKVYVFAVWKGVERWISEAIITKIEGPQS